MVSGSWLTVSQCPVTVLSPLTPCRSEQKHEAFTYFSVKCCAVSNKAKGLSDAVESPCHFYIVNVNATKKEKTRTFSEGVTGAKTLVLLTLNIKIFSSCETKEKLKEVKVNERKCVTVLRMFLTMMTVVVLVVPRLSPISGQTLSQVQGQRT